MVVIKLSRVGKRSKPAYRLIVLDRTKDPWGAFLENVGNYNPRSKELNLNVDRIKYWLSKGAQPSNTVHNMFVTKGVIEAKKKRVSRVSKQRKEKLAQKEKDAEKSAQPAPANA
ncbi:MAG: 30S ribosomal protein S16 [Patescibacteria group bacterium]